MPQSFATPEHTQGTRFRGASRMIAQSVVFGTGYSGIKSFTTLVNAASKVTTESHAAYRAAEHRQAVRAELHECGAEEMPHNLDPSARPTDEASRSVQTRSERRQGAGKGKQSEQRRQLPPWRGPPQCDRDAQECRQIERNCGAPQCHCGSRMGRSLDRQVACPHVCNNPNREASGADSSSTRAAMRFGAGAALAARGDAASHRCRGLRWCFGCLSAFAWSTDIKQSRVQLCVQSSGNARQVSGSRRCASSEMRNPV